VDFRELVPKIKLTFNDLSGKSVAVDAYNTLYQFLTIIRGPSGEPLMDRQGRVTSHLSGVFYRSLNMIEKGLKLVYVFDGTPPALKEAELKTRKQVKEEALSKYNEALRRRDYEAARKYAQMTARLKDTMVDDVKILLDLLGIPWVQAPSEGEAQAAYIASKEDVWAAASQDYDSLLFGAPRLIRNLAVTGRRKLPKRDTYVEVEPELMTLDKTLSNLNISKEQLIYLGILVGTDYNPGGSRGIGPKTALKLIKDHKNMESIINAKPDLKIIENYEEISQIFLKPEVTEEYDLEWHSPDIEGAVSFLCGKRDFSELRVRNALEKSIDHIKTSKSKRTLDSFFS
jgi:flap endonuclease-1